MKLNEEKKEFISDKELLTFSNLVNLEWQFTQLNSDDGSNLNVIKLLAPENFMREDADGNFLEFPYMPKVKSRDNVTEEDIQAGINQMRRKAGVAMQYLDISARSYI